MEHEVYFQDDYLWLMEDFCFVLCFTFLCWTLRFQEWKE